MTIGSGELIGGLVFLIVMFVLGYVVYRSTKSTADFGKSAVIYFVSQNTFWLFVITFVMMIAEAGLSATFHPEGEKNVLPFGIRFVSHLGFAMTGWIMLINTGPRIIELISFVENEKDKKKGRAFGGTLFLKIFYVIVTFVAGIFIPLTNLYIVALGLEEEIQFKFFVQDYILFQDLSSFYPRVPIANMETKMTSENGYLPPDYNPFSDMSYPLQLMIITFIIQTVLGIIKGVDISAMYREMYHTFVKGKPDDKKDKGNKDTGETKETKPSEEKKNGPRIDYLVEYALISILHYSRDELENYVARALSNFNSLSAESKTKILASLAALMTKHQGLMSDPETNKVHLESAKAEALRYLNNPISSGGLNLTLSSKRSTWSCVKCNSTVAPTEDNHRRNLCDRCASVVDLTNYYIEDVGNCVECGIYLPLNDKGVCKSCDDERKKESTNFNFKHGSVTKTCVGCNNRFTIDFSAKNAGKTPSAFCHLCETRLKSNICLKCHDYTNGIVDNYGRCEVCSQ